MAKLLGRDPPRLFRVTSRVTKFTSLLNEDGRVEVKELSDNNKSFNSVSWPIVSGILPPIFAEDRSSKTKRVRLPIEFGRVPLM